MIEDPSGLFPRLLLLILVIWINSIINGLCAIAREDNYRGEQADRLYRTGRLTGVLFTAALALIEVPYFTEYIEQRLGYDVQKGIVFHVVLEVFLLVLLSIMLTATSVFAADRIAQKQSEKWIVKYKSLSKVMILLFAVPTELSAALAGPVMRLFRVDPKESTDDVTEEEIISLVDEGNECGVLQDSEAEMIRNIVELDDTDARDIMTHRKNISAIDINWSVSQAMAYVLEENNSRYPVYEENIDDIKGVLHIRDLMLLANQTEKKDFRLVDLEELERLMRPVSYIPETKSIDTLFQDMQLHRSHLYVVVDEYGQTAGIVTMEDILEEIVGNIQDEYDDEEEPIQKQLNGDYLVHGLTTLEELEEETGIVLVDEESETLNGYLIGKLEHVPVPEERCSLLGDGCEFRIISVEDNIISKVLIHKEEAPEDTLHKSLDTESEI